MKSVKLKRIASIISQKIFEKLKIADKIILKNIQSYFTVTVHFTEILSPILTIILVPLLSSYLENISQSIPDVLLFVTKVPAL